MPIHRKSHDGESPLSILTELAVEGTSSFVETQRTLLDLVQQEQAIVLNGVKERVAGFAPAVAMTDLVQRSVDTLVGMQQELLTATSKQTLEWLESETAKGDGAKRLVEFAREGVETFTRAQKKFIEAMAQESANAMGKHQHDGKPVKKTELREMAREAADAFIEAQKRLLDVMSQQMNVNLEVAARTGELMSPSRLAPVATLASENVRKLFDAETSMMGSLIHAHKPKGKPPKKAHLRRQKAVVL